MSSIRPNNFPPLSGELTGDEEVYTQTNGVNNKFTLNQVADFIVGGGKIYYVERTLNSSEISNLSTTPITIIDVSTLNLSSNQLISVENLRFKYEYGSSQYNSSGSGLSLSYTNTTRTQIYRSVATTFLNQAFSSAILETSTSQDYFTLPQEDIQLSALRAITGGDGTLTVGVWYRIIEL